MTKFLESKLSEWLWRGVMTALLAAVVFLRDSASKADLVPIRQDVAEIKRTVMELDKKLAIQDALRDQAQKARSAGLKNGD